MKPVSKRRDSTKQPGLPPGSLVHIGERRVRQPRIRVISYGPTQSRELEVDRIDHPAVAAKEAAVRWINVDGIHDTEVIEKLGRLFDLHPLLLEDIMHTGQRPKTEDYQDCIFVVLKVLTDDEPHERIGSKQVSLVMGADFVLSFQEGQGDVFEPVRLRISGDNRRIRSAGPDYLLYALMDAVVDRYFVILERIGDRLESIEEGVFSESSAGTLRDIQTIKKDLIFLRRSVWPLREALNTLLRSENQLIKRGTDVFFRDVYDHTIQIIDTIEAYRDSGSALMDSYLSIVSNRMNEVMKVLTVIATTFIPLTFIAGVYGMNFEYMPELKIPWAYPLVWLVMVMVGLGMVAYFRRRRWL